jgi:hypothetical protein
VTVRQVATLPVPVGGIVRLMLYEADTCTYLFMSDTTADGPCVADEWYERADAALGRCRRDFGVWPEDWRAVPDPVLGGRQDVVGE